MGFYLILRNEKSSLRSWFLNRLAKSFHWMPSHYLLTTCLLSVYDYVVLLYVVRHTVVWLHHRTVALTW